MSETATKQELKTIAIGGLSIVLGIATLATAGWALSTFVPGVVEMLYFTPAPSGNVYSRTISGVLAIVEVAIWAFGVVVYGVLILSVLHSIGKTVQEFRGGEDAGE